MGQMVDRTPKRGSAERASRVAQSLETWLASHTKGTAKAYQASLQVLARLAAGDGHPTPDVVRFGLWLTDEPEAFAKWMQHYLDDGPGAAATRRKHASPLAGFVKALRRGRLPVPTWTPRLPHDDEQHAPVAPVDWSRRAVAVVQREPDDLVGLRSMAMLRLAECGLRASEIADLRLPEAIEQIPLLRVGEDRVNIGSEAWAAIARWVERRGSAPGWLFVSLDGRSGRFRNVQPTARTIQRSMAKTAEACGVSQLSLSSVRRRAVVSATEARGVKSAAVMGRVQNPADITAAIKRRWRALDA